MTLERAARGPGHGDEGGTQHSAAPSLPYTVVKPERANPGDAIARARLLLAQRVEEARTDVGAVLASPVAALAGMDDLREFDTEAVTDDELVAHANQLLTGYLDPFKSAVFNGKDSVRLAVSGKRLKKVARRLHEALEQFGVAIAPVTELAASLARRFPRYHVDSHRGAAAALEMLRAWDYPGRFPSDEVVHNLLESIERHAKIRLAMFVCPPVDFALLYSAEPEHYLREDMHGSVLSRLVDRLRDLFRGLEGLNVATELTVFIGDTDEDDYLWHGVTPPKYPEPTELDTRRARLIEAVRHYLTELVPGPDGDHPRVIRADAVVVERLSARIPPMRARDVRASILDAPLAYFGQADIDTEVELMKGLWRPGSYYDGLPQPDENTLTHMVERKFAAYAMQGMILRDRVPNLVLIQTERPPLLRTRMLSAGCDGIDDVPLATVDFFEPEPDHGPSPLSAAVRQEE